jgi:hypothetical protein
LGPEGRIFLVLRKAEKEGSQWTILTEGQQATTLHLSQVRFRHVLVKPENHICPLAVADAIGNSVNVFVVVAKVEAEAVFNQNVRVSYLGLERIPFTVREGKWVPCQVLLPKLSEVLSLLDARVRAIQNRDLIELESLMATNWKDSRWNRQQVLEQAKGRLHGSSHGVYKPSRWVVQVDREGGEVLEEKTETDQNGAKFSGKVRFVLLREEGKFRFASGLM